MRSTAARPLIDGSTLRLAATLAVSATFSGVFAFVTAHPKNPDAPLQPPAPSPLPLHTTAPAIAAPSAAPTRRQPRIGLTPAVRQTAAPGVTFTHTS